MSARLLTNNAIVINKLWIYVSHQKLWVTDLHVDSVDYLHVLMALHHSQQSLTGTALHRQQYIHGTITDRTTIITSYVILDDLWAK